MLNTGCKLGHENNETWNAEVVLPTTGFGTLCVKKQSKLPGF